MGQSKSFTLVEEGGRSLNDCTGARCAEKRAEFWSKMELGSVNVALMQCG